ncbi:MAG TPA: DNA/RNA non-specific endonuclease [Chitinophagales bacterium]|nr:DNA/RNA non-specific endonuclease [Chitinophagales bacterium]
MKIVSTLFLFICINTSVIYSQDSVSAYQLQKDIFKDIETSKIKYIQKLIDSVGIASPIPNEILVKHLAFTSSYNPSHRVPNYVVHVIPKDILYGTATRTNDFRIDPFIKQNMADSVDYWNSGFDRGHMAASADFKWNRKALSESYYYSNIVPQNKELNQGAWNKLEMQAREWAIDNSELIVVTGPVLENDLPKIPQGSFKVSIPQYLYKIVLDYYPPVYKAIAFIYPNKNVPYELEKHVVSIDSIEKITGIDFFPKLNDSLENILEAENNLTDFDTKYFDQLKASQYTPKNFGKGKINTAQVKEYIGKDACVCGKVVSTKFSENGKTNPTYINLDKKYPEQVFTLMIFGQDRQNFSYKPEEFLQGKTICVKGKIGEYKGSPQIIANKEKQVEILKD